MKLLGQRGLKLPNAPTGVRRLRFGAEVFIHGLGGKFAVAHGEDDSGGATDDVSTCEHARNGCHASAFSSRQERARLIQTG